MYYLETFTSYCFHNWCCPSYVCAHVFHLYPLKRSGISRKSWSLSKHTDNCRVYTLSSRLPTFDLPLVLGLYFFASKLQIILYCVKQDGHGTCGMQALVAPIGRPIIMLFCFALLTVSHSHIAFQQIVLSSYHSAIPAADRVLRRRYFRLGGWRDPSHWLCTASDGVALKRSWTALEKAELAKGCRCTNAATIFGMVKIPNRY